MFCLNQTINLRKQSDNIHNRNVNDEGRIDSKTNLLNNNTYEREENGSFVTADPSLKK